jgi:Predicted metal-binding integral membrane protein (DUF2182)
MRKDVRAFIRRLESVGLTVESTPVPLPRPARREAAPKAERNAFHAPTPTWVGSAGTRDLGDDDRSDDAAFRGAVCETCGETRTPPADGVLRRWYLAAWTVYGLVAYAVFRLVTSLDIGWLAWNESGAYVAGAVVVAAGIYELTPVEAAQSAPLPQRPRWRQRSSRESCARP